MFKQTFLVIVLLLVACSKQEEQKTLNYETLDTNKINIVKNSKSLLDLFQYSKKIELEVNEKCIIGQIKTTIFSEQDSILFIHDGKTDKIFKFSINGKFIDVIDKNGKGPEEYEGIDKIIVEKGKIYIIDNKLSLVEYNTDGDFIKKYVFNAKVNKSIQGSFYNNNFVYIFSPTNFDEVQEYSISKYSLEKDEIVKKMGTPIYDYLPVFSLSSIMLNEKYLIYTLPVNKNIYQIDITNGNERIFGNIMDIISVPEKVKKIKTQDEFFNWSMTEMIELEPQKFFIDAIYRLDNFLIFRNNLGTYDIFDGNGNQLQKNINLIDNDTKNKLVEFEINNIDLSKELHFYSKGLIIEGFDESKIKKELINPTLLFFEMKEK